MKTPPRVSTEAAGIFLIRLAVLALLLMGLAKTWADPDSGGTSASAETSCETA